MYNSVTSRYMLGDTYVRRRIVIEGVIYSSVSQRFVFSLSLSLSDPRLVLATRNSGIASGIEKNFRKTVTFQADVLERTFLFSSILNGGRGGKKSTNGNRTRKPYRYPLNFIFRIGKTQNFRVYITSVH